jgi:DNA-binding beta-propeller fold protein YncE
MTKATIIIRPVVIFALLFLLACGGQADRAGLEQVYRDYQKAVQDVDVDALKGYISSRKQKELLDEGAEMKLRFVRELMPVDIEITHATISGGAAVLELKGRKDGQVMTGTVDMVEEGGQWKIDRENWQMTIEMTGESGAEPFMKDRGQPPRAHQVLSGHQGEVTELAFTPDSRYLVSASYGDYSIRLWDLQTGEEISSVRTANRVRSMALPPDGTRILTADAYNNIIMWPIDFDAIGEPQTIASNAGDNLAISPDGELMAVTGWKLPVRLWNLEDKQLIDTIDKKTDRRVLAFSPSGKLLAGGGKGNNFTAWETGDWDETRLKLGKVSPDSDVMSIAVSPDDKYVGTGHSDSSIVIYDLEGRRELHNYFVTDAATRAIRFSPDGQLFATAHQNRKIYLWDTGTAEALAELKHHADAVVSLAFSPDGTALASGGEDRQIVIWTSGAPGFAPGAEPAAAVEPTPEGEPPAAASAEPGETIDAAGAGGGYVEIDGNRNFIKNNDASAVGPASSWETKGDVSIETDDEGNHIFVTRYSGMFWQDAPIEEAAGRYALLVAWASSERVNSGGDQTGAPYLYGYMLNKDDPNKINAYLNQGDQLLLKSYSADEWGLIYGIFQVPDNTGGIRFFMQQADGRQPQNGSAARFDEPGIFFFDSHAQAMEFLKNY